MTTPWYDCLLLKNRTLTKHEKESLARVNVTARDDDDAGATIGPEGSPFDRPMDVEPTHHHHLDALLALMACHVDPKVDSLRDFPARHVHLAAVQRAEDPDRDPARVE